MKTRELSNEFSSPDGIRTHDLFLEREATKKSALATKLSTSDAPDRPETRVRRATTNISDR